MIVYADEKRTLHAEGMEEDVGPLVLRCICNGCGQEISRRVYDVLDAGHIEHDAAQDARVAKRHQCHV